MVGREDHQSDPRPGGKQLPAGLDLEVVIGLLSGPFFYRRLIAHRPIPPDLVQGVVGGVLPVRDR
ncbi:hypothetical protein ABGB18_31440 [Nonomuraea sp. B12E4]|uniref:hypothetical protein n=1 Tax=Nonomuraea sp. B12E4 TaxID=3153564 RepID=UPI00325EE400